MTFSHPLKAEGTGALLREDSGAPAYCSPGWKPIFVGPTASELAGAVNWGTIGLDMLRLVRENG